ncbi:xanthine dehydrogenase [Mucilaginibacter sp. PPCGB 2223]|uniref:XdhC family protein n=1 Tax=Mucilaginibacter sp. PPCGB 2223 TaxID=1886027 RepID=UPI0008254E38|nr:XdhC/CoxI family protein [Mucilaginibacter sp. PPCGB 2223]OCX54435.1 xanthine dehydrogenase [Mucilaginibacter sp. PPCGB 2223]
MKQQAAWKLIADSLQHNIPVMLLYVLESKGSSPGRRGFMMAVDRDGQMVGSIGGGIMEHKFVEMVKEKLLHNEHVLAVKQQVHDKAAAKNQSGMICSGEQTILLYQVNPEDALDIDRLIDSLEHNQNGLLTLSPKGLHFDSEVNGRQDLFNMADETEWLYQEVTGYINHLFIIGGGHCALALSRMMSTLGFYVHIYENRPELNTLQQNDAANEKTLVADYNELAELIESGEHNYVVLMTWGYRTDDIALRSLMNKDFKYLGVLGSKKKIKKMFTDYAAEGMDEQRLKKIFSPIGIQIKSQTPEEIAVSIAAQIIKVKNAGL